MLVPRDWDSKNAELEKKNGTIILMNMLNFSKDGLSLKNGLQSKEILEFNYSFMLSK